MGNRGYSRILERRTAKGQAHFSERITTGKPELIKGCSALRFPTNTAWMSAANGGVTGRRSSISAKEGRNFARGSSSSPPAPRTAGEVAPQAPCSAGTPPRSPSAGSTTQHSSLQTVPEVQLRLRSLRPPHPSQLSSRKSFRPERGLFRTTGGQRRQQGRAFPSQAHSTPPRPGPGSARRRDREGEPAPLPPPYLPY